MGVFGKLFGSKQNEDKLEDENYLKTIIESSNNEPIGISENNVMYAGHNELGGYYYFQAFIVGSLKIKTKKGAKLIIAGNNYNLELNSDMPELESDPANPLKGYVTKIDFEIEKNAIEKIKRSTLKQITLLVNKKEVVFSVYSSKK